MSGFRAFIADDDENDHYMLTYCHNPSRWNDNILEQDNPMRNVANWSKEIKYLNDINNDISDEIKHLPTTNGGIYIFYVKGINITFMENYILYIGRCQYTANQNIRKRATEYFKDPRVIIRKMFRRWQNYLYYRYYPDTDNEQIRLNEIKLIRAILPEYNETIPDKIIIQNTVPAFN